MASGIFQDHLVSVKDAAKLLGISARQVHRLRSSQKMCPSLMVGGSVRFRVSTLTEWLDMSCPDLKEFLARKGLEK